MPVRRRRVFVSFNPNKQPAGTVFKNSLREWRLRAQAKPGSQAPLAGKGNNQDPPA
jgi:hypothetical protein